MRTVLLHCNVPANPARTDGHDKSSKSAGAEQMSGISHRLFLRHQLSSTVKCQILDVNRGA
jgi:hypothetical protein